MIDYPTNTGAPEIEFGDVIVTPLESGFMVEGPGGVGTMTELAGIIAMRDRVYKEQDQPYTDAEQAEWEAWCKEVGQ